MMSSGSSDTTNVTDTCHNNTVVMEIAERRPPTNLIITRTAILIEVGRALALGEPVVEKAC